MHIGWFLISRHVHYGLDGRIRKKRLSHCFWRLQSGGSFAGRCQCPVMPNQPRRAIFGLMLHFSGVTFCRAGLEGGGGQSVEYLSKHLTLASPHIGNLFMSSSHLHGLDFPQLDLRIYRSYLVQTPSGFLLLQRLEHMKM